jgi:hypothetical protein
MRAVICIFALILVLPAIFATGVAQAKIKPIPRPAKLREPAASTRASAVTPLAKPVVHVKKRVAHAKKPVVQRKKTVARTATRKVRAPARASTHRRLRASTTKRVQRTRVLARSRGGRYVPPAHSHGGRHQPPPLPVVPVAPDPTPLGFVAIGEALPSSSDPWPSWVFSLLGVMAASEVYLLVHLARARSFA